MGIANGGPAVVACRPPCFPRFRACTPPACPPPACSHVSLTSSCGSISFSQQGFSAQFGTVSAKKCATLKVCSGTMSFSSGGSATAGGKLSLLDPSGLVLLNGCVTAATACVNASQVQVTGQVKACATNVTGTQVQLGGKLTGGTICVKSQGPLCQGSAISGKSVSLTSGTRINQVGCGLVKACSIKLLSSAATACVPIGTAGTPLQICSLNVTVDPASAFLNDRVDPTTLSLTTAKGCLQVNAPNSFNVTFKGACQILSANSPNPLNLTVDVTCSNIKLGCVDTPGSTVSITAGSCARAFSILCGSGKLITASTLSLSSGAFVGKACAPITVCARTLNTHGPCGVHVINTFKCPNVCTSQNGSINETTNESVVSVTNCTATSGTTSSTATSNSATSNESVINTCAVATTTTAAPPVECTASLGTSGTSAVSQGFFTPTAPGGLLASPDLPSFPGLAPINDPLQSHFELEFPAPEEANASLLPDNKKQDKRSLFRRLFMIRRHHR